MEPIVKLSRRYAPAPLPVGSTTGTTLDEIAEALIDDDEDILVGEGALVQ
jgi:hypothetical protein